MIKWKIYRNKYRSNAWVLDIEYNNSPYLFHFKTTFERIMIDEKVNETKEIMMDIIKHKVYLKNKKNKYNLFIVKELLGT